MALTTTYIVVPFLSGAAGMLHPGTPRRLASRAMAVAAADGLTPFYAGVVVLRDRHDSASGIFLEPLLIWSIGSVPGSLLEACAA